MQNKRKSWAWIAVAALTLANPQHTLAETAAPAADPAVNQADTPTALLVSGRVVDEEGEPLIGVAIRVKDKKAATVTRENGEFTIGTTGPVAVLEFTYIGMKKQTVTVREHKENLVVKMAVDHHQVSEVVVTGYQSMSRRESAAAISQVKMEDVFEPSAMNLDQMLQGKIPGMAVMMQSGEPSSTPTIRIRGNSTINGNKAPVWVVDGVIMSDIVPFTASDLNSPDAAYLIGNAISGLSPQDIETITVLKDASATAIYGVKAANGVIVVTTKRGKVSAPTITYDFNLNVGTKPSYSNFSQMNSQERVQLSKDIYDARLKYPRIPTSQSFEGALQRLLSKKITQAEFEEEVRYFETLNTDWFDLLFRHAATQNHNVSLNGGTERIRYYSSVSYNNSPGIAKGSESDRFTALNKLFVKINNIFDADLKLEISNQNNTGFYTVTPFPYAFNTARTIPAYNPDGSLYFYSQASTTSENGVTYNILNELNTTGAKSTSRRMGGVFNFNARPIKGLTYTLTASYYWNNNRNYRWATDQSYWVSNKRGYAYGAYEFEDSQFQSSVIPMGGIYDLSQTANSSYTIRNTVNYINTFAEKHEVNVYGGIEARADKYVGHNQEFYGWNDKYGQNIEPFYTNSYLNQQSNGSFAPTLTDQKTQIASYFGTASYTFNNRYVINGNIRSDGANKFGSNPKYRWLPTWSVAGKWYVSNEKIFRNWQFIDNFAIRASYGVQGNIHEDATPYLIARMARFNTDTGLRPAYINKLPNPDLRWERTKSYNIGIDASFFEGRLTFTADYYQKRTSDLITDMQVSPTTGRIYLSMNAGKAINKGYEGVISGDIIRSKLIDWNLSLNLSHNTNEIQYAYEASLTDTEKYKAMLKGNVATIGQPLGTIYSFKYAGLSEENGYPLFYTIDGRKVHEGDYEVMELVPSGSIYPDLTGGIDTRITYRKNLSLSIGFSYQVGGVRRLPDIYQSGNYAFDPVHNVPREFVDRWRQPGDEATAKFPALYDTTIADEFPKELKGLYDTTSSIVDVRMVNMYDQCDYRVAKSDFLRLRNVTLSYRLPHKWLKPLNIRETTVRLQGSNLFILKDSKWQGLDPETAYANMPILPSYNLGINIMF